MNKGIAIFLCDVTGIMAQPWVDAGYRVVLVDPQHPAGVHHDGLWTRVGMYLIDAMPYLGELVRSGEVVFVAGFPVCTDVAVSGSGHWESKRQKDPYFQARATMLAEQCRAIGILSGAPWFFENPVSAFSSIFGKPQHSFHPYQYGGYLPEDDAHPLYPEYIRPRDAYPKKTCLWTGGGFLMPERRPVDPKTDENGFSDQHNKLGGKSERTKNIRSATPRGFSLAVFEANAPHLRGLRMVHVASQWKKTFKPRPVIRGQADLFGAQA